MKDPIEVPPRYTDSGAPEGKLLELLGAPPLSDARMARCERRMTELASAPPSSVGLSTVWKVLALSAIAATSAALFTSAAPEVSSIGTAAPAIVSPREPSAEPSTNAIEEPPIVTVDSLPSAALPQAKLVDAGASRAVGVSNDRLLRELALVDRARAGVLVDPEASLRDVNRHSSDFPDGQLVAEREVIAVHALLRLGRRDEARARGEAFIVHAPGSSAARRIASLLDEPPGSFSR